MKSSLYNCVTGGILNVSPIWTIAADAASKIAGYGWHWQWLCYNDDDAFYISLICLEAIYIASAVMKEEKKKAIKKKLKKKKVLN